MILFRETSIKHWSCMRNEQANLRHPDLSGTGFLREPQVLDGDQKAETDMDGQSLVQQAGRTGVVAQEEAGKSFSVHTDEHGGWSSLSGSF